MYLGVDGRGRLAGEMRWRLGALIALFALVVTLAGSGAAKASHPDMLRVSVRPPAGSPTTHFAVRFRAAVAIGQLGPIRVTYRITASTRTRGRCQSSASAVVPPSRAGAIVQATLAPARSKVWCTGTFRGQLWEVITERCRLGLVCPEIVPAPRVVGTFTFRVTRG